MSKFALLFLLVFVGGIFAALFYSGAAAFVLYQLVYFLNPDDRWWSASIPGISYSFVAAVMMIFSLAIKYKSYSSITRWNDQPVLKWMVALLLMYCFAYFFALEPRSHKIFTFQFAKLIIIVFVAYKIVNTEKALNASIWSYLIGCVYIGYLATTLGRNDAGRVEGIGMVDAPDANDTAAALVPAAVFLMYFAWMGGKKTKLMCVLCGAVIANGLVLINSRGSFLGVSVSLAIFLFYMIFSKYRRKGQRAAAMFMIVLGLSGAFYMTDDLFWKRMSTLTDVENQEESGSSRVVFWMTTFDMLKDHPLGLGVYGFNSLASSYMDDKTRGGVENRAVHSMWFQGLSEIGWQGFIVFIFMIFSLYRQSKAAKAYLTTKRRYEEYFKIIALECAFIGYIVAGTFIDRFRAEILYWMILLLLVGINVYYFQAKGREKQPAGKLEPLSSAEKCEAL